MSDIGNPWHSQEPADKYRQWFPVFPNYPAFDTVGIGEDRVGLSTAATRDLKKKILAAAIASKLRISLSYAEKRYVGDDLPEIRELGLTRTIDGIFDQGFSDLKTSISLLMDAFSETETLDDLSNQFIYRNIAGLEAAKKLSDLGFLCEVAVILRSLLEQFAFAAKLRTLPIESGFTIHSFEGDDFIVQTVPAKPRSPTEFAVAHRLAENVWQVVPIDEADADSATRDAFCRKSTKAGCVIETRQQLLVFARATAAQRKDDGGLAIRLPDAPERKKSPHRR